MSKGYCTTDDVASWLGITLSDPQTTYAETLIGAAESYVDRDTHRAWIVPPVVEQYHLLQPQIFLRNCPVVSIQSVTWRTPHPGDIPLTLTQVVDGIGDYELIDASIGWVTFSAAYRGRDAYAYVSYTPNIPVPADISLATAMIVGTTMSLSRFPDRLGITSAQADSNTKVTYGANGVGLAVPEAAQCLLDNWNRPIGVV